MKHEYQDTTDLPSDIEILLRKLESKDGAERQAAREVLVKRGKDIVPYLIELLSHPEEHVRWEACKTLEKIRDPRAAYELVSMLLDDDMDVRWVAADAIIELEQYAIVPLLELIEEHFDSVTVREAAHHVLHTLKQLQLLDEQTEAVLDTLKAYELPTRAGFAASKALDALRGRKPKRKRRALAS